MVKDVILRNVNRVMWDDYYEVTMEDYSIYGDEVFLTSVVIAGVKMIHRISGS